MRIVTWNCNMALHRKFDALLSLCPDIAVIQECAHPDILTGRMGLFAPEAEPIWIGSNKNKGLGIFTFNGYRAILDRSYDPKLRFIAPVKVTGGVELDLLGVWAQNANDDIRRKATPGPMADALSAYADFLSTGSGWVVGDFNNNVIWDKPGWAMNHADTVHKLDEFGLKSAYHSWMKEEQGAETIPTHYWRDRRKDGPTYHIDFIFGPAGQMADFTQLAVGNFENWCGNKLSDHVPILVEIG